MGVLLFIPSPAANGFWIGSWYIRYYALCLILGIVAAYILGIRRWKARGGASETFETAIFWALPFGIVGARIYHVLTHLGDYFATGINPWSVFFIWEGGIAIFGAIAGGAVGALIGCRVMKIRFSSLADTLAPAIALGQAIGRFGNWFNQELYGSPTDLPWALEIAPQYRVSGFEQYATFHPTFLYEAIWNVLAVLVLLWADKKFRLGRGKVFALYIAIYGFGRTFTEGIRLDYSYDTFGAIRFNQAVAMAICVAGIALLIWLVRKCPGQEANVRSLAETPQDIVASGSIDTELSESFENVADVEDGNVGARMLVEKQVVGSPHSYFEVEEPAESSSDVAEYLNEEMANTRSKKDSDTANSRVEELGENGAGVRSDTATDIVGRSDKLQTGSGDTDSSLPRRAR